MSVFVVTISCPSAVHWRLEKEGFPEVEGTGMMACTGTEGGGIDGFVEKVLVAPRVAARDACRYSEIAVH